MIEAVPGADPNMAAKDEYNREQRALLQKKRDLDRAS